MSTSGSSVRADRRRRHHYASECPTVLTVAEGVEYVFGIPGEETIRFVDALNGSGIRYVMVRHEQAASFMAEIYGPRWGPARSWRAAVSESLTRSEYVDHLS
ncbi:thiamine pyrophosphate-binding protein [Streptomyces sp. NBC_01728]|uniref:thiamine pyrophosphate-binding protein n=1 Tax=unclassified Streptomyces TaxID=2593676 RepID=UPI00225BDCD5|nr:MULTISPECIES: thiamine pyrophosphate-binding protein [unclassified Streptomyces]MCX4461809.1 thiamine pyrophosphate-binding protein [Streptomyces sp. NBC_01719]MCX4490718.1 thiamine pyrophosphate-binding protein [Streptomyces sp. NBC_01728]